MPVQVTGLAQILAQMQRLSSPEKVNEELAPQFNPRHPDLRQKQAQAGSLFCLHTFHPPCTITLKGKLPSPSAITSPQHPPHNPSP
jgi:hypothetical protein